MKNKIVLMCGFLVLILSIAFGTYTWYLFFLNEGNIYNSTYANNVRLNDVVLTESKSLYIEDAKNTNEDEIDKIAPYTFVVSNTSNKENDYILYIEDLPLNLIKDGCTSETLLQRGQLKYQLKLNEEIVQEDFLSNIKDNILDNGKLKGNEEKRYELRIYIDKDAKNWSGKHYHYRVVLNNY